MNNNDALEFVKNLIDTCNNLSAENAALKARCAAAEQTGNSAMVPYCNCSERVVHNTVDDGDWNFCPWCGHPVRHQ